MAFKRLGQHYGARVRARTLGRGPWDRSYAADPKVREWLDGVEPAWTLLTAFAHCDGRL